MRGWGAGVGAWADLLPQRRRAEAHSGRNHPGAPGLPSLHAVADAWLRKHLPIGEVCLATLADTADLNAGAQK